MQVLNLGSFARCLITPTWFSLGHASVLEAQRVGHLSHLWGHFVERQLPHLGLKSTCGVILLASCLSNVHLILADIT